MNNLEKMEDLIKREMVWINREFYRWRRTADKRKSEFKQRDARYDDMFNHIVYLTLKPYLDLFKKYGHKVKSVKRKDQLYTYDRCIDITFKHPTLEERCVISINFFWHKDQGEKVDLRCYIDGADIFEDRDENSYLYEDWEITPQAVTEMIEEHLPEIFKIMREEIFFDLETSFDYQELRDKKTKLKKPESEDSLLSARIIRSWRRKF